MGSFFSTSSYSRSDEDIQNNTIPINWNTFPVIDTVSDDQNIHNDFLNAIKTLPRLNIGSRQGSTDYIDFIKQEELGDNSAMFGVDLFNREFLVIKGIFTTFDGKERPFFQTFFKRMSYDNSRWNEAGYYQKLLSVGGGLDSTQKKLLTDLVKNKIVNITDDNYKDLKSYHNDTITKIKLQ